MNSTISGGRVLARQKRALSKVGWKAARCFDVKPRTSILRPMLISSAQARTLIAHNFQ
jgi:hypothetical protein